VLLDLLVGVGYSVFSLVALVFGAVLQVELAVFAVLRRADAGAPIQFLIGVVLAGDVAALLARPWHLQPHRTRRTLRDQCTFQKIT
jgi:hypothetical protein